MPNPRDFLKAFELYKHDLHNGVIITKVKIGHIVVERYRKYKFPIEIQITTELKNQDALQLLLELIGEPREVLSQYGNPYNCYIEECKITGDINIAGKIRQQTIQCTGWGDRVFY